MTPDGRIKVLHIVLNLHEGGLERVVADLVRRVDPQSFEMHVLVVQFPGRLARGLQRHGTLHLAGVQGRLSMLWPRRLEQDIRAIAPDIVHTHSGVWYKGSLAARQAGVRFLVHTDHGRQRPDPWSDRMVDRLASRRTDVVVAVSEVLARQLRNRVVMRPERVRAISNGIDTEEYRPRVDDGSLQRELGIADRTPVIGSIGRLDRIKAYDVLVEAFRVMRSTWNGPEPAPVLVIAGDGPDRPRLQDLIRRGGFARDVRLLGWREDIHRLHAALSVFTLASHSEGTSIALLEAMSAGLCPVVTDVGGNSAVLGPGLTHRLVPPGRPIALAEAWRQALDQPSQLRHDGRTARAIVQARFSLTRMVAAYEDVYKSRNRSTA